MRSGRFVRVEVTNAHRVGSRSLKCWLRVTGSGLEQRLRLGTGEGGRLLFPTAEEAAEAARREEQARRETAEAGREDERAGRVLAEAEVARLLAELARLKRGL
jgi:hypothetical protein